MAEKVSTQEFIDKLYDFRNEEGWKYKGDVPCIIDFYADWCGPCKAIAPILNEISDEYSGKLNVYKVDVDTETEVAEFFGIQSIPTLFFVPSEGEPTVLKGALTREGFRDSIKRLLLVGSDE